MGVSRDFEIPDDNESPIWVMLEGCPETTCLFNVHYNEKVLNKLDGSSESTIVTTVAGHSEFEYYTNDSLHVLLDADLSVEHWKEYLEYGYIEWIMAMGGVISLGMTTFFFCSWQVVSLTDGIHMGILPTISLLYSNYYTINEVVNTLKRRKIWSSPTEMEEDVSLL